MSKKSSSRRTTLFYSYSHKDINYKSEMETTLSLLRREGFLTEWSDAQILPGQPISSVVRTKQHEAQISAFLISPDFLDSDECMKEWQYAKQIDSSGDLIFRVPIIIRECAWLDFLKNDNVKALPIDGKPIATYSDRDTAWQEVYEGIRSVVEALRHTHTAKQPFEDQLNSMDVPSLKPAALSHVFVFPNLVEYTYGASTLQETIISSFDELRHRKRAVIHGEDKSGKTALAKQLTLSYIRAGEPVLYLDIGTVKSRPGRDWLRRTYEDQFNGDYDLWKKQDSKSLVVDNMSEQPHVLDLIVDCKDDFSQIHLFAASDIFYSFLRDESQLAEFDPIRLESLTLRQQEKLIRNGLETLEPKDPITDGFVDQIEDRVNSIIISDKIVPRYPFFVLSILQTYDAFMPHSVSITSYGHCYQVLILATLHRAGISTSDQSVNSCFNFAEQLALATFRHAQESRDDRINFTEFCEHYSQEYFIQDSLLSRLTHKDFGIITKEGLFKTNYMYYFFLGRLLASDPQLAQKYLPRLCEHSYTNDNYLTLLFTIHHATDDKIIEDIMIRTMVELEELDAATLNDSETARFSNIISELPDTVLSVNSVEEERAKERHARDSLERVEGPESEDDISDEQDQIYVGLLRVLKNNKILGRVLRNQSGKLPKRQIEEIIGDGRRQFLPTYWCSLE